MLVPVVTLDAQLTVAAAREVLAALAGGAERMIVVRRRHPDGSGRTLWYAVPLDHVERLVSLADPDAPLGFALDLHEHQATSAADHSSPAVRDGSFVGVVVRGGNAVGYATGSAAGPRKPTRSIEFPAPAAPSPAPTTPRAPAQAVVHPRVLVPAELAPSQAFDVEVGLGADAQAGMSDAPMTLALPARRKHVELTVTVVADGFTAPSGVTRTLLLPRDDLVSASVRIPLVAPADVGPEPRRAARIEVEYAVAGHLLGRAWREVTVVAARSAADLAGPSTAGGDLPLTDTGFDAEADQAVDLTVSIVEGTTPGRLVWTFTSPHPLGLPDEQVSTELPIGSAQAFSMNAVRQVAAADGSTAAEARIEGIARTVASATPVALWTALTTVWAIAKHEGRVPRVLIVAAEPYIPWELASTEKRWVVDRTLVDEYAPQVLGAQCQLGRWTPAGPQTPAGVRRPPVAPEHGIQVRRLAVVVGDYHSQTGVRPLPLAEEEGQALVDSYPCLRLTATLTELTALLEGRVTDAGKPATVEVVHVACHGTVDPAKPESNGIVLSDTALRIDELAVLGGELGEAGAPLVFLNACQLAQATGDLLADQGGLAGAFLAVGARGFVAPLWSVDDELARDIAVDFYRYTLGDGLTVGEALRRLRGRFSQIPDRTQTTPLAYVYYGHPDLRLALAG